MKRAALTLLAALSLVLFFNLVIYWARSYRYPPHNTISSDILNLSRTDPLWWIVSQYGHLTLCRQAGKDWGEEFGDTSFAGFSFGGLRGPSGSLYNLRIPYWFPTTLSLALPILWSAQTYRRAKRNHRLRHNLCPNCAYDLRATPDRCPECGAVPAPTPP
jgi:hypothetical protein